MKNHPIIFSIALLVLAISACKTNTGPTNNPLFLTATINGKAWTPTNTLPPGFFYSGSDTIIDFLSYDDTSSVDIQVHKRLPYGDTGTYPFGYPLQNFGDTAGGDYTITSRNLNYIPVPKTGTMHLSVWSATHITATFSFKAKDSNGDSVVVTNGQLDMGY